MLQQTQVKTVLERFYFQFLKKFPTLKSLADASQEEVLSAWQGLGYYTRARNLHTVAKNCIDSLPKTVDELISLPGIGRNTAHAIAAFAYHQPVAIMEANVRRVISRIYALTNPNEAELWQYADCLLDKSNPFDYNQAMMDIGALVCKKTAPLCNTCPAQLICKGKQEPHLYPSKPKAKAVPTRYKKIILLHNNKNQYYARPRTTRFLNGLYHFIEAEKDIGAIKIHHKIYDLNAKNLIGNVIQQYSHFTLDAEIYVIKVGNITGKYWHDFDKLGLLPVSVAERKIFKCLRDPVKAC